MKQILPVTPTEYHALDGISSGAIRCFAKQGPWMYHARYVEKSIEVHDTNAKRLGRAFHLAMSDPADWMDQYEVIPSQIQDDEERDAVVSAWAGRVTKASLDIGSEIKPSLKPHREYLELKRKRAEAAGLEWVTEGELTKQYHMIQSVYHNPAVADYVDHRNVQFAEVACVNKDKKTGLKIKALGDLVLDNVIVDFKTTRAITANSFIHEALNKYSYQYQGEWYLRVFEAERFVIISVRNEPPWESMVYTIPQDIIDSTRERNDYHMQALKGCYDTDDWHSLGHGSELDLTDRGGRYPQ